QAAPAILSFVILLSMSLFSKRSYLRARRTAFASLVGAMDTAVCEKSRQRGGWGLADFLPSPSDRNWEGSPRSHGRRHAHRPNDFSPPTARTGMVRYQPFKAVRLRAGQIHQDRKIQEWISPVI